MYDTYARYIYEWLINNEIADKISSLVGSVDTLINYVLFFGLAYIAFKFLNKRWLGV